MKKGIKIIIIVLISTAVFIAGAIAISKISEKVALINRMNDRYAATEQKFTDGDYDSVISDINDFNQSDDKEIKSVAEKYDSLYKLTETTIYDRIFAASDNEEIESLCIDYMDYFPGSDRLSDVDKKYSETLDKLVPLRINEATQYINNHEYVKANDKLQSVIDNSYVADSLKQQADELSNSIAGKVADEKAERLILGTWSKATGVQYTFEEDGHMSMNLLSNYDASLGTTLDGFEVKGILKEIEECGRILRGGLWEYNGVITQNGIQYATYTLFSQSSYHDCIIQMDCPSKMGIALQSGIGDMSYLTLSGGY